jgi:hypothetical protein
MFTHTRMEWGRMGVVETPCGTCAVVLNGSSRVPTSYACPAVSNMMQTASDVLEEVLCSRFRPSGRCCCCCCCQGVHG